MFSCVQEVTQGSIKMWWCPSRERWPSRISPWTKHWPTPTNVSSFSTMAHYWSNARKLRMEGSTSARPAMASALAWALWSHLPSMVNGALHCWINVDTFCGSLCIVGHNGEGRLLLSGSPFLLLPVSLQRITKKGLSRPTVLLIVSVGSYARWLFNRRLLRETPY